MEAVIMTAFVLVGVAGFGGYIATMHPFTFPFRAKDWLVDFAVLATFAATLVFAALVIAVNV